MELKTVKYDVADRIATLTLNRPHRMNAWTGRMHHEYRHALALAEADDGVRAVVITGEGRGFCVGGDAKALEGHAEKGGYDAGTPKEMPAPGAQVSEDFQANFAFQFGMSKPIVAAVNGAAAGVGLVIACFADLRFASRGAKYTTAHGKLNLPAEYGLSWILPRLIGHTRASELLLSSRKFTSDEAWDLGLLNRLTDAEDLLPETYTYVQEMITENSPASLAATKHQLYLDWHRGVGAAVQDADRRLDELSTQPDYAEAISAFMEKRTPNWSR